MSENATENVTALRPLSDEEALAWLKSQGKITMRPAELGRRFGWTRQRTGRRLDAWKEAGQIKRRGHTIIADVDADKGRTLSAQTPGQKLHGSADKGRTATRTRSPQAPERARQSGDPVRPESAATALTGDAGAAPPDPAQSPAPPAPAPARDLSLRDAAHVAALYVAAIAATGIAACFSVAGFAVMFPGAPMWTMVFDAAMEFLKIAAAGFLAAQWRSVVPLWRLVLIGLIITAACINGLGVYSQLMAAHVSDGTVKAADTAAAADREVVRLEAAVLRQRVVVGDVKQRIKQPMTPWPRQ